MKLRLNASSVVVGLAIGALAAGGITYAGASGGGTTINACQSKSTGALRVLTTGTCKSTEVALSWGSQGPQGDVGIQGPAGATGAQGAAGPAGARGEDGRGADRCELASMDWYDCDFTGRSFDYAPISRARLQGANLSGASLVRTDAVSASLRGAIVRGANLRQANFSAKVVWQIEPYIETVVDDYVDFSGSDLSGTSFAWVSLKNANFSGADLTGADLGRADLRGANIEGANLSGVTFAAAYFDWRGNWTGSPSVNPDFLCNLQGTPKTLPDGWSLTAGCLRR